MKTLITIFFPYKMMSCYNTKFLIATDVNLIFVKSVFTLNVYQFWKRKYIFCNLCKISFGNFKVSYFQFEISKIDIHSHMYLGKLTDCVHPVDQFRPGVRYNFSVYGCRNQGYQLLRSVIGYVEELGKLNG